MRWNERENKENAVRLIVHSLTHRGERWEGGGVKWRNGGGGVSGSFVSTYKRDKMVWQYITFQLLLYKKGTFTYCDSNPGDGRNQKMWRCWSQIAIDYMKFCINPLRLVYVPPPPPPPLPSHQLRPFFPKLGPYHHPVFTLTRGIQGCPKTISLNKNTWHPALKERGKEGNR